MSMNGIIAAAVIIIIILVGIWIWNSYLAGNSEEQTENRVGTQTPSSTSPSYVTGDFELTASDTGKYFSYPPTSRFSVVLNGTQYPSSSLQAMCTATSVIGAISNQPSAPGTGEYARGFEAVSPGTCLITNDGWRVTILVTQ